MAPDDSFLLYISRIYHYNSYRLELENYYVVGINMYFISQLFISSRNTGLLLCNNFVYVASIVMIHKYGTAYPSLQRVNSLALSIYFSSRW